MNKTLISSAAAFCLVVSSAAFAADRATSVAPAVNTTGNGAPSGAHYNLNIIGVENPKKTPMTGGDGHTIFVALGSKTGDAVESNIWLTQGDFQVCDANGFDPAYNCAGAQIGRGQNGAVFQLPCNTLVPTDFGCMEGTVQEAYTVWIRPLGAPGGKASMTTCAYDDTGALICNTGDNVVSLSRGKGKQSFQDVTTQLTSLQDVCFDLNGTMTCGNVSLFNSDLQDYVWQYQNNGLRLAQVRFYPQ